MTERAQGIMEMFKAVSGVKTGMVLSPSELAKKARQWGEIPQVAIAEASEELRAEGFVIITATGGLELTDRGYFYLFQEV